MINVLFVCLGNICRSPMAEGVFKDLVKRNGLSELFNIDSAGTASYHMGNTAHRGTLKILADHNIIYQGRARKITEQDLNKFDYIIAMDSDNLSNIKNMDYKGTQWHKMNQLLDFAHQTTILNVPDPYYTGNFEQVYKLVLDGCNGLLVHISTEKNLI